MERELSPEGRLKAALALLEIEGARSVERIDRFLQEEPSEQVRAALCLALSTATAHLEQPLATLALARLLIDDGSALVRLSAIKGLSERGDPRALESLRTAAEHDPDPGVKKAASRASDELSRLKPRIRPKKVERSQPQTKASPRSQGACPSSRGLCQCSNGAITTKPRCLPKEDCLFQWENNYRHQGFKCSWNSQFFEE